VPVVRYEKSTAQAAIFDGSHEEKARSEPKLHVEQLTQPRCVRNVRSWDALCSDSNRYLDAAAQ
jgi:hypothetical protein